MDRQAFGEIEAKAQRLTQARLGSVLDSEQIAVQTTKSVHCRRSYQRNVAFSNQLERTFTIGSEKRSLETKAHLRTVWGEPAYESRRINEYATVLTQLQSNKDRRCDLRNQQCGCQQYRGKQ